MGQISAPFSPKQVVWLNAYQVSGAFHPFTCGNNHAGGRVLVAQASGWFCTSCDFTQDWAHEFMASPRWLRRVNPGGM